MSYPFSFGIIAGNNAHLNCQCYIVHNSVEILLLASQLRLCLWPCIYWVASFASMHTTTAKMLLSICIYCCNFYVCYIDISPFADWTYPCWLWKVQFSDWCSWCISSQFYYCYRWAPCHQGDLCYFWAERSTANWYCVWGCSDMQSPSPAHKR